ARFQPSWGRWSDLRSSGVNRDEVGDISDSCGESADARLRAASSSDDSSDQPSAVRRPGGRKSADASCCHLRVRRSVDGGSKGLEAMATLVEFVVASGLVMAM